MDDAWLNEVLEKNRAKRFVQRIYDPNSIPPLDLGNGSVATHQMAWGEANGRYFVFPTVMEDLPGKGNLKKFEDKEAWKTAIARGEIIEFDSPEQAAWFSENYKRLWEQQGKNNQSIYGFPLRTPYPGEDSYFKANTNTTGMATEDNAIILNPYSNLSDVQRSAVATNEAIRLWLRKNNIKPMFELTPEQLKSFESTSYTPESHDLRNTILARLLTNDPSAGTPTEEQLRWVEWLKQQLEQYSSELSPNANRP